MTPRPESGSASAFTAWLLYETLTPADAVVVDTVMEYAVIVMKEAIAGLLIGFGANICMAVVNFAGSIADMEAGLSMATLLDPATKETTSITGVLYQYSFMLLMLIASECTGIFSEHWQTALH